ncbi:MAG: xanthine dehydrogenase family protein molybdopterin-binding subunit, partial [Streptomyces sp.]
VVPHALIDGWAVRTNNPPSGHVRGEGAMQVCAAYEGQMDKLAKQLGLDPAELRMRNVLATGDLLPTGQTVTCPAPVAELLRAVRESPLPPLPKDSPARDWLLPGGPEGAGEPGAVRRGVGYALGMVHMLGAEGADEVSTATVKVNGPVATVMCAAVETGQGFSTLARQIVQETLGLEEVHVASVDTDQPPAGAGAHGRHTWVSGGAVERAAKMVRTQLLQPLAANFGMSTELLTIADGKITSYDGVLSTTVAEALDGKELWATAQCRPHPTEPLDDTGQGDAFVGLAFAAVRAVVDVDVELGSVRVVEMAIAQDVGRVLNPRQLRARIEAGITQGVGAALTEHLRINRGVVRRADFTGYALPTALDAPDIRIVKLVEEQDVVAPFGAKPASAVPVVVSPAAVASAVRAATGRPVNRLPIRPQAAVRQEG